MTIHLNKIYYLLSAKEKKFAIRLFLLIFLMSIFDVLGVASVMPFIALLLNPNVIETNDFLNFLFSLIGNGDREYFLVQLGTLVFIAFSLALLTKALALFFQLRFSLMKEYTIGRRLMLGYLSQRYEWFLDKHSSELSSNLLSELATIIHSGMMPVFTLISQGSVALIFVILLLIVDSTSAIFIGGIVLFFYIITYLIVNKKLEKIGNERAYANKLRFKIISEAFKVIKDIKINNSEEKYISIFDKAGFQYANQHSSAQIISLIPRFILEAVAFGGMIIMILLMLALDQSIEEILPLISLYAVAGYRLIPALQQVYNSLALLKYIGPAVDLVYTDYSQVSRLQVSTESNIPSISLNNSISLRKISYRYPGNKCDSVSNVNLDIKVGDKVAIVGLTGSGKTTLIDILSGILPPSNGELLIDKVPISTFNLQAWQQNVGYVTQNIFLNDSSIALNIANEINADKVNMSRVKEVAKIAHIDEFIENNLRDGYETLVGESGIRLSGGQRQRIALARALYKNPKVLILDEATSSLDNSTENRVVESLEQVSKKMTVVIVAHKLASIINCDKIFVISNGTIEASGDFDFLLKESSTFRQINLKTESKK